MYSDNTLFYSLKKIIDTPSIYPLGVTSLKNEKDLI